MSTTPSVDFSARRARFRQYDTAEAVVAYLQRLETQWPERAAIVQHIAATVMALRQPQPHVLELGCGPGRLAEALLAALPNLHYTGVDLSPPFLNFARQQLTPYPHVKLLEVDLSNEAWPQRLTTAQHQRFHAIVSMQALHDVGDETAVSRVYGMAHDLLWPGGFFLNADLVVAEDETLPNNPGRRPLARHLALLHAHGYHNGACTLASGGFACVIGWRR